MNAMDLERAKVGVQSAHLKRYDVFVFFGGKYLKVVPFIL
jgi:hypothetical protein